MIQPTIVCSNRFQVLAAEEDEPGHTVVVGDSIVRRQDTEFCGRMPHKRRLFCIPGAGIDDVVAAVDQVSTDTADNALFILHAGTNDIRTTRSEELLEKYRRLIQQYKTKSSNILISGVLPRIKTSNVFYSRAFSLNSRLRSLCREYDVNFVNMWDGFYNQTDLFQKDGLHLSSVGAARFGRLLNEAVKVCWAKNGARTE